MDNQITDYKKWILKANEDLKWTEGNLKEKIWFGACFTSQQAAEKALKAYLIKEGKEPIKVHDLEVLLRRCIKIDGSFQSLKLKSVTLTDYYAPTRYPDIDVFVDFTEEKAEEAYQFAKEIVEFVESKLENS